MKILVLNGPNLNMIGIREKGIYGSRSYADIVGYLKEEGTKRGHEIEVLQSNYEGQIIEWLQKAYFEHYDGVIINPGAFTHYSYALHELLKQSQMCQRLKFIFQMSMLVKRFVINQLQRRLVLDKYADLVSLDTF